MKKILILALAVFVVSSGCSLFKKDPQKAVNKGILNFSEVEKMSSSLVLRGTVASSAEGNTSTMKFSFEAKGKSDTSREENPASDVAMKMNLEGPQLHGKAEFELRTLERKIFMKLGSVEIPGQQSEALKAQLAPLMNKWWSLPAGENPVANLTEQQKLLQEKFKNTQFFVNAQEGGKEDVEGIACSKYRVDLDKDALQQFIFEVARGGGKQISPQEEQALSESLKDVEFSGAVWVGEGSDTLHRIAGTITIQPAEGPSSSFEVDYRSWDHGKDVVLEEPAASENFNLLVPLMSLFMASPELAAPLPEGGAGSSTTITIPIDDPLGAAQVTGKK